MGLISDRFWRKPPVRLLSFVFPHIMWKVVPPRPGVVHLTFDDGPSHYTAKIADFLSSQGHGATFFLSGCNLPDLPGTRQKLNKDGHGTGYHGHDHLDGWQTDLTRFQQDFLKGAALLDTRFYRPPYGRLTFSQYRWVKRTHKVVMWDVMPGDFLLDRTAKEVVDIVLEEIAEGSIIVLHDNEACGSKVLELLPPFLDGLKKKGLRSEAL